MRDNIIRICWNTPMCIDDALLNELSNSQGLYYISRVFGKKETSLYLGIATQNNTIRKRLSAHKRGWLKKYRGKILVRIGQIQYPLEVSKSVIEHAESAIVFEQSKVFYENTSKTNSYTYKKLYRVENIGDIFELKPMIRMHEHPEYENSKDKDPNSLINRWLNDPNPVRVLKTGGTTPKIEIKKVNSIDECLNNKSE